MQERAAARRYARSLLIVAEQMGITESIETDLLTLKKVFQANPGFRTFFTSPLIPRRAKEDALKKTLGNKVVPLLLSFLNVLVRRRRFDLLPGIADDFDELADQFRGIVRVEVRSFQPLADAQRTRLVSRLSLMLGGKQVETREHVDRALLGGMWVRVGDMLLDGSAFGRLKWFQERLLSPQRS